MAELSTMEVRFTAAGIEEIAAIIAQLKTSKDALDLQVTYLQEESTRQLERIRELQKEIETDNQLIAGRNAILDELLCPLHGRCVLYAIGRIVSMKKRLEALEVDA